MANKKNPVSKTVPVENHETAAWIGSWDKVKEHSQVCLPTDFSIINAKEWVDSNQL